ncbi:protein-disulfide reductase DsbD domain-containing protein [Bartonella sp. CB175]|uniref:protein-disulfide reductase DsbD domain-containing protein n=1 Tax=Bartonella sp. CB175 TaxID=3112256 RepID=UPI00300DF297
MKKTQISINSQRISIFFYKKLLAALSVTFIFLGLLNSSVSAQQNQNSYLFATPWYKSDGGQVRLAITKPSFSGARDGIIKIVLKPGWKTYWRNPGNSGMAPFFNFNQQVSYEIFYPVPQLYETENDWSLGYKGEVTLPFTISDSKENLNGSLTLGLCNKICIPFTVNFDFSSSALKNERLPISLLKDARDSLPYTTHPQFKISAEKDSNTLFIKIQNSNDTIPSSLFLDGGEMQLGPAKKINDNVKYTLFSAPIHFIPDQIDQTVFYTVSFKDYALSGTFTFHTQSNKTANP